MKTLCYSVRLKSLERISDKAYRATAYDGSSDIIPVSQVFGCDTEVENSEAYWISSWILERKSLQYSTKKVAWLESGCWNDDRGFQTTTIIRHHKPANVAAVISNEITDLKK